MRCSFGNVDPILGTVVILGLALSALGAHTRARIAPPPEAVSIASEYQVSLCGTSELGGACIHKVHLSHDAGQEVAIELQHVPTGPVSYVLSADSEVGIGDRRCCSPRLYIAEERDDEPDKQAGAYLFHSQSIIG